MIGRHSHDCIIELAAKVSHGGHIHHEKNHRRDLLGVEQEVGGASDDLVQTVLDSAARGPYVCAATIVAG